MKKSIRSLLAIAVALACLLSVTPLSAFAAGGTVTYYLSSEDTTAYATQTYNEGDPIVPPEAPTKEGYTFAGWAATAESKVALADLGTLDVDLDDGEVIFYAVWTEADGVNYSVEIYVQATDGSYALSKTETATGKTGSAVTV